MKYSKDCKPPHEPPTPKPLTLGDLKPGELFDWSGCPTGNTKMMNINGQFIPLTGEFVGNLLGASTRTDRTVKRVYYCLQECSKEQYEA